MSADGLDPEDFVTALSFSPEENGTDDEMVYLEAGSYILLKKSQRGSKMVYTYLGPSGESHHGISEGGKLTPGHKLRTHLAPYEAPIRCLVTSHKVGLAIHVQHAELTEAKDRLAGWGCRCRVQGEDISLGIVVVSRLGSGNR